MDEFVFAEIQSPPDERDWNWEALAMNGGKVEIPEELDLRKYCMPVWSQGSRGTCAAFTATAIKEYQEIVQYEKNHGTKWNSHMSPDSVYFYRSNKPSAGMYGRNVMQILQKKGICTNYYFPYSDKEEPTKVPKKASKEMPNFKIANYARISTIEGAKSALMKNGPLYISFPVYRNGTAEFWKQLKPTDKKAGGHAVTVVGWTKKGFIIRNSWGRWNGNGHVIYKFEDFGCHWEIWTTVDEDVDYIPPHMQPGHPDYEDKHRRRLQRCCNLL